MCWQRCIKKGKAVDGRYLEFHGNAMGVLFLYFLYILAFVVDDDVVLLVEEKRLVIGERRAAK